MGPHGELGQQQVLHCHRRQRTPTGAQAKCSNKLPSSPESSHEHSLLAQSVLAYSSVASEDDMACAPCLASDCAEAVEPAEPVLSLPRVLSAVLVAAIELEALQAGESLDLAFALESDVLRPPSVASELAPADWLKPQGGD